MFPRNTKHEPISEGSRPEHRLLLVVAAPAEADAIRRSLRPADPDPRSPKSPQSGGHWVIERLGPGVDLIETGVGKAQAAGGTAWAFDPTVHTGVLSLGIAGALPPTEPSGVLCPIGCAILATTSVLADEGVRTPEGFVDLASIGFPPGSEAGGFGPNGAPCTPDWAGPLGRVCDTTGVIATVSACSGTDEAARAIAAHTQAIAENMEGAAVAAALSRLPLADHSRPRFAEIRIISNTTGDRDAQVWDLPTALDRLGSVAANAVATLRDPQTFPRTRDFNSGPR